MESRAALSLQQPAERAPTPTEEPPRRLPASSARLTLLWRPAAATPSGLLRYLAFPPVDPVPRAFARANDAGVLDVGPVRLGDVICFEDAYDHLVRDMVTGGGRLLVVQTNNASVGRSGENEQQLVAGRLRAVEHGRTGLLARRTAA